MLTKGDGRRVAVAPESVRAVQQVELENEDPRDGKTGIRIDMLTGQEPLLVIGDFDKIVNQINTGRRDV